MTETPKNQPAAAPDANRRKRRYSGVPVRRIEAGGDYDEWFEISTVMTTGDMLRGRQTPDMMERGYNLLCSKIKRWSLVDEEGKPLPITPEVIRDLDVQLINPVLDALSESSFLAGTAPPAASA